MREIGPHIFRVGTSSVLQTPQSMENITFGPGPAISISEISAEENVTLRGKSIVSEDQKLRMRNASVQLELRIRSATEQQREQQRQKQEVAPSKNAMGIKGVA